MPKIRGCESELLVGKVILKCYRPVGHYGRHEIKLNHVGYVLVTWNVEAEL